MALKKLFTLQNVLIFITSIFLIIGVILFLKYQTTQTELNKLKSDPRLANDILTEVGKIMVLPEGEAPQIATVTDVDKLKVNQPFFNSAKNGDKIILYTNKAILYDPSTKKIIDVTIVNPTNPSPSPISESYKFTILNGTQTNGLGAKFESSLKKLVPNAVVVSKDFAKKDNYQKSILVDISGTNKGSEFAQILNIPLENLPSEEIKPTNADFLVIIGKDKENL